MKLKLFTAIALTAMAIISCDEDTSTLGDSLTSENDQLVVTTQNFGILTRSVTVDSVFTRERQCYFGKVMDPETKTYVKSEFTTQFNMMEDVANDLPSKDQMLSLDGTQVAADSCVIFVQFDASSSFGDTLTTMKMKVQELDSPVNDTQMHYSCYDPSKLIRKDGINKQVMFALTDLTMEGDYYRWARVYLNEPYTAKDGTTYSNYGSYILSNFYAHPEYYKNSYAFVNHICPGFYFQLYDGIGVMARIAQIDMYTYYHFTEDDVVLYSYLRTTASEEVVQTTKVTYDRQAVAQLADDNSCTYLKTPAGLFTEVTIPVDEICQSHPNDSLLSAKVLFHRMNNQNARSSLSLSAPSQLLLIEKDSLNHFFEGNKLENNTYAYRTSLSKNAYQYDNISNLITRMYNEKVNGMKRDPNWIANHPNWNKALLVPVDEVAITSTSTSYYYGTQTTSTTVALKNQMGLTSTRLIKGTAQSPIKIEVIYAKFQD